MLWRPLAYLRQPVFAHAQSQSLTTSQAACDHLWEVLTVIPASTRGPGLSFVGLHRAKFAFLYGQSEPFGAPPQQFGYLRNTQDCLAALGVASASVLRRGKLDRQFSGFKKGD